MGLPLIVGIGMLLAFITSCSDAKDDGNLDPEQDRNDPTDPINRWPFEVGQCVEYQPNSNVEAIKSVAEFDCYSYPSQDQFPSMEVCVERGLPESAANFIEHQTRKCAQMNIDEVGGSVQPNIDPVHAFLVDDPEVGAEILGGDAAAGVIFGSGEIIFLAKYLNYATDVQPWDVVDLEDEKNNRCIDPLATHETFHFVNWTSPTNMNPIIYQIHTTLEEGLARFQEISVDGIRPDFYHTHHIESFEALENIEGNIANCMFEGDGDCEPRDYECCEAKFSNWTEIQIDEESDPIVIKFMKVSNGINFELKTQDGIRISTIGENACARTLSDLYPQLRGGVTCFFTDPENQDAGDVIITSAVINRLNVTCDDENKMVTNELVVDIGGRRIPNDTVYMWSSDELNHSYREYGYGDVRSYGTGYCFWKRIEKEYGNDAIPSIVGALQALGKQEESSYTLDVSEVISKEVGVDYDEIRDLIIFYGMNVTVEGVSEKSTYSYYPYCEESL